MNKIIKNILNAIEKKGYEAYLVGGYVRDLLVGKESFDIDICTNATPKELINIFPHASFKNLGGISFKIKEYNFEITTYREEIKYEKRHPVEYNYVNNLISDLNRRDFTINTICMNKRGEIIDLLKGIEDLNNLKIRMVGNLEKKLNEDPLRIMRAIRLATVLNFTIEDNLFQALKTHKETILTLSSTRLKEGLDRILISSNVKYGLSLLNEIGILNLLAISYTSIIPVKNIEGMYAQINIGYKLPFTKVEKNNIKQVREILNSKEITALTVYKYGLYLSKLAGAIMNISQSTINKLYKNLPIKSLQDINITPEEIVKILNIEYSKTVSIVLSELEFFIISGKIKNKKNELIKYITNNKARWGV